MRKNVSLMLGILVIAVIALVFGCTQPKIPDNLENVIINTEGFGGYSGIGNKINIYGNGTIVFESYDYTKNSKDIKVGQISKEKIKELVDEFHKMNFFSLKDEYYDIDVLDTGVRSVSITIEGRTKTVRWNFTSVPRKVTNLRDKIYNLAVEAFTDKSM